LAMQIGLKRVVETARSFQFSTPLKPYPSIALGAFELVPLELARAYCAFAADGVLPYPLSVKEVVGEAGQVLERRHMTIARVTTPAKAFLMSSLLRSVVTEGTARGLQEGGIFPSAVEDAVLLDAERQALSPLLRTSVDQLDEAVFVALSRLASIGASAAAVCLSFSCRDTRQFRDSFPSWIVLQAFRLMKGDASLTYERLATWLGEPKSAVPASPGVALTEAGWWLAGAAKKSAARSRVLAAFPALVEGLRAESARASVTCTAYDGYVPAAGPGFNVHGIKREHPCRAEDRPPLHHRETTGIS
jgi:hypothetical protein